MAQKLYFGFNAAHTRKSAQATGSCNTVTGNNDRDRVCAARLTDSLRRGADYGEMLREFGVDPMAPILGDTEG